MKLLAVDTETTGVDLWHGCKPFYVSTCNEDGAMRSWEWDVNPETREPIIPQREKREVYLYLAKHQLIFHNTKFDVRGLNRIGITIDRWDMHDTLVASHVVASGESHKLKDLALLHLGIDDRDQQSLQEAVNEARRYGRSLGWRIAKVGDPHFPAMKKTAKDGWWPMDMWLPRAVAKHAGYPKNHRFWSVCSNYADTDAERTIGLWYALWDEMKQEDLLDIYETRRRLLEVTFIMEERGVTVNRSRLINARKIYIRKAQAAESLCFRLADFKVDNLASPKQVEGLLYGNFGLKPIKQTKASTPDNPHFATDKDTISKLQTQVRPQSRAGLFLTNLVANRKNRKAASYLDEYEIRGMTPYYLDMKAQRLWWVLNPNFNITGTRTPRFSSNSPNQQNVSKQEVRDEDGNIVESYNLREVFGPVPGREWYSQDYENIELRIFAYSSGDKRLIKAFESGYSVHLLIAEILFPKEWKLCQRLGVSFKDYYKSTLYQWTKNGNFSIIYGASEAKADSTYHLDGAYAKVRKEFPLIRRVTEEKSNEAREYGYVTTLGGYRLQVASNEPHKALNYFVQGTAGWCIILGMVRIFEYLRDFPSYYMIMQIHDELDFDFPKHKRNLAIISECARLMAQSGGDIGIPTPVDVSRHRQTWAQGEHVTTTSLDNSRIAV